MKFTKLNKTKTLPRNGNERKERIKHHRKNQNTERKERRKEGGMDKRKKK